MTPVTCTLCKYYSPDFTNQQGAGICRRHPPVPYLTPQGIVTVWPSVRKTDWCADGESGTSHDSLAVGEQIIAKGNGNIH